MLISSKAQCNGLPRQRITPAFIRKRVRPGAGNEWYAENRLFNVE